MINQTWLQPPTGLYPNSPVSKLGCSPQATKNSIFKAVERPTVCSFQNSGVFATCLIVVLGVFCLFAACVFCLVSFGFPCFCWLLLFVVILSYVPSEQPACTKSHDDDEPVTVSAAEGATTRRAQKSRRRRRRRRAF